MFKRKEIKYYFTLTDISSISRRYFIIGFFDGILTILGLNIGAFLSKHINTGLMISTTIATGLALGISSGWGAYEAERIEQNIERVEKEKALLFNKKDTILHRAHNFAIIFSSFIHAVSPILASLILLIPYTLLPAEEAFYSVLALGFSSLFILGLFFGKIAKVNMFISGIRMLFAGIFVVILVTLLNPSHFA